MNKEQVFKATKLPVTIEAIQLTDKSMTDCIKFIDDWGAIESDIQTRRCAFSNSLPNSSGPPLEETS